MIDADRAPTWIGLIGTSVRDFRKDAGALVGYDLLFKLFQFGLAGPVLALAFMTVARWNGGESLSNSDIAGFLLTPVGVAVIIVSAAISLAFAMVEQAGLMLLYHERSVGHSLSPLRALLLMLRRLPGLIGISAFQFVLWLLCVAPLAAVAAWIWFHFLAAYDINYLWTVKPPVFLWSLAGAGILALAAALLALLFYMPLIFAVPFHVIAGLAPRRALQAASRLVRDKFTRLVWILLAWLLISAGLTLLSDVILNSLTKLILPLAGNSLVAVAMILGGAVTLEIVSLIAVGIFTMSVNAILILRCYRALRPGEPLVSALPTDVPPESKVRSFRWVVLTGVVAFFVVAVVFSVLLVNWLELEDEVIITAHRAGAARAPENTIAALEQAILDGADFAEIDVQESADGEIVVLHDTDLLRVAGLDRKIWELTYDEVRELDAGSWFAPRFAGERIPTLRETIVAARDRIGLNIELKPHAHGTALVENVVRIIEEEEFESQCVITSLDFASIRTAKRLNPELQIGYIVFGTIGRIFKLDVDLLSVSPSLATEAAIFTAHYRGRQIHVWTVNDSLTMSKLIDRGVDGIITDRPGLLVRTLEARREMSEVQRLLLRTGHRPWDDLFEDDAESEAE